MKTLNKAILALGASSVLAMSANAGITYGSASAGEPYVGVKVGQIDVDGFNDKLTAYGVYGGYNFDQNFGVELEYLGSSDKEQNINGAAYDTSAKTYGAYGTYRYHFNNTPVYVKGKLGVAKTEAEAERIGSSYKEDTTGLAGGVAVGFNATSNFGIEAGYNYLDKDASMWGVGAHLKF